MIIKFMTSHSTGVFYPKHRNMIHSQLKYRTTRILRIILVGTLVSGMKVAQLLNFLKIFGLPIIWCSFTQVKTALRRSCNAESLASNHSCVS